MARAGTTKAATSKRRCPVADLTIRPTDGPKRLRENAALSVEDGQLIVTDAKERRHSFTLDKTRGGPALFCTYTVAVSRGSAPEQAFADAHRLAIVRTRPDLWDQQDLQRLAKLLDLVSSDSLADAPTGKRQDCVDLL